MWAESVSPVKSVPLAGDPAPAVTRPPSPVAQNARFSAGFRGLGRFLLFPPLPSLTERLY